MLTIWLWSFLLIEFNEVQPLTLLVTNRSLSRIATPHPLGEYEPLNSGNSPANTYLAGSLVHDAGKYVIRIYEMVQQRTTSPKKNKKTKFPLLFPSHKVFVDPFGNRITFSLGFSVNFNAALN